MNHRLIKEARARTTTLVSYAKHKKEIAKLKIELLMLLSRSHEYKNNVRIKLTKRRKVRLGNDIIKKRIKSISVKKDIKNQIKLVK